MCEALVAKSETGRGPAIVYIITATMFYLEHAFEFFDKLIVGEARGNDQSRPYIADQFDLKFSPKRRKNFICI